MAGSSPNKLQVYDPSSADPAPHTVEVDTLGDLYVAAREECLDFIQNRANDVISGFRWHDYFHWTNESNLDNKFTRWVEQRLRILDGLEIERDLEVSAAFRGLGISAGGSRKTFSERGTARTVEISEENRDRGAGDDISISEAV
ncbi:hypothetical protein MMC07_001307 [Pseudocyphellaria aurata]|nr:hypothetical protein [Pseudocyphellaria aurata]